MRLACDQASLDLQEVTTECKNLRQENVELNAAVQGLNASADDALQKQEVTSKSNIFHVGPDFLLAIAPMLNWTFCR